VSAPRRVTVDCLWCGRPFQRSRFTGGHGTPRRFCTRPCILAAVGLPADFDPAVLELDWHGRGPRGGRSYDLSEITPAAERAIRAVLDAVARRASGRDTAAGRQKVT